MALDFGKLNFSTSFNPTSAFPLDARSYFESLEEAQAAAATAEEAGSSNTVYYYGETVAVNEDSNVTLYIIQPDKTLKEVGSVPLGDGQSIEVVDGEIKIKGFGNGYYAYSSSGYTYTTGFIAGLQPQVRDAGDGQLEIAWYQPNPTTVEGLETRITSVEGEVDNLQSSLTTIQPIVNNAITNIASSDANILAIERSGANVTLNVSAIATKKDITTVFKFKGTVATAGELPQSAQTVGDVYYVTENDTEYVWTGAEPDGTGWEEFGPAIDLSGYATTNYVTNAIGALDYSFTGKAANTIASIVQENGVIAVTPVAIAINANQVTTAESETLANALTNINSSISGVSGTIDGLDSVYLGITAKACSAMSADALVNSLTISVNGTSYTFNGSAACTVSINTEIPVATSGTLGGIKVGFTSAGENYAVQLDANNAAYVTVPVPEVAAYNGVGAVSITANGANYDVAVAANGILTSMIADGQITTAKIADNAVTDAKIVSINTDKITQGSEELVLNGGTSAD